MYCDLWTKQYKIEQYTGLLLATLWYILCHNKWISEKGYHFGNAKSYQMYNVHTTFIFFMVVQGRNWRVGRVAHPFFGRIEGAARPGSCGAPYQYLPTQFQVASYVPVVIEFVSTVRTVIIGFQKKGVIQEMQKTMHATISMYIVCTTFIFKF